MKTLSMLIVLAATLFSSQTFAESPSVDTFRFDCNAKKMPSQQTFAKVTGINNLAEAYDERVRMRVNLLRQCHEHQALVLVVQFKTQKIQAIAKL